VVITKAYPCICPAPNPYSVFSISGAALSGRKLISGRFSVRSDSSHRQNVKRLAGYPVAGALHVFHSLPLIENTVVLQNTVPISNPHGPVTSSTLPVNTPSGSIPYSKQCFYRISSKKLSRSNVNMATDCRTLSETNGIVRTILRTRNYFLFPPPYPRPVWY
jgi:hypothetical protein